MPEYMRGYCDRAAAGTGKPGTPIRFVASTENVGRDGLILDADGWELDNFRANPAFLWVHDYMGERMPIGRVINVEVKERQLMADVEFDQEDDFALQVESKYRRGFLNAVSVGWDTKEFAPTENPNVAGRSTRQELLDISAVPIPGDPKALKERQMRALKALGTEILELADGSDDTTPPSAQPTKPTPTPAPDAARLTWPDTAATMVALYQPFSPRPDDERRAEYQRLDREYSRHGKTSPEFKTGAELEALSPDDIRGLFSAGEPELFPEKFAAMANRAGAVLSQRNRSDLDKAGSLLIEANDLIKAVIERAQKEADQQDEQDTERAALAAITQLRDKFKGVA